MTSNFVLRGIIFGFASIPLFVQAQRLIEFPRFDGKGDEQAVIVPVDEEGLYVTIGVVAADVTKGKAGEEAFEFLAQDVQSRITLLRGSKPEAGTVIFGEGRHLKPGDLLSHQTSNENAVVVSWETYFEKQLLPLSFLRIHHQGEIPAPGWPLMSEDGKIIAISHQGADAYGNGTYGIPAEAVQRVVSGYKKHGKIRRAFCGINLDAGDSVVSVFGVRPESPAKVAGLQKRDIILSMGGYAVQDYADATNGFFYLIPGEVTEFVILRGLEKKVLKITPAVDPRYLVRPPSAEEKK